MTPDPITKLEVRRLGVVDYEDALAMQRALVEERKAGSIADALLILQHPPVITVGVKGDGGRSHVIATDDRLAELGVQIHETGRGGDVTYHGPGQIVGYPILDLRPDRCDVHRYVRDVEEVMIRACADYGVSAGRIPGLTGTWIGSDKIGAIGIRISKWVTSHGFAFNVSTNLDHFKLIVPCGLAGHGVTSLERESGGSLPLADVEEVLIHHFASVFEREIVASATPRPATAVTSIRA